MRYYLIIFLCAVAVFLFKFQQVQMFFGPAWIFLDFGALCVVIGVSFCRVVCSKG